VKNWEIKKKKQNRARTIKMLLRITRKQGGREEGHDSKD
jgi:hypothetical protein